MDDSHQAQRLEKLRASQARTPRDLSLGAEFKTALRSLKLTRRRLGGVAQAWEAACPAHLLDHTSIQSLRRGVLTIRVADAATNFQLERALSAGARDDLIRQAPCSVRTVRLITGDIPER